MVITTYNRYIGNTGRHYRVGDAASPVKQEAPPAGPPKKTVGAVGPMARKRSSPLSGLLPKGMDAGDIMLFLMLFLLYSDSGDEDFLIIMAVLFFTL